MFCHVTFEREYYELYDIVIRSVIMGKMWFIRSAITDSRIGYYNLKIKTHET